MPEQGAGGPSILRFVFWTLFVTIVAIAVFLGIARIEQFLITDQRFKLAVPPDGANTSDTFQMDGLFHTSEQQVFNVFARDFGRSIYLCPIAERRRHMLAIDWVKDATVSRIWPNRLHIRIVERTPVAYAQIPTENGTTQIRLIDADGVLLNPEKVAEVNFAVLAGIPRTDTEAERRERVKRFLQLRSEVGPLLEKISEIDVADIENVKVALQYGNEALTLYLGNQKFKQRLQMFFDYYPSIQARLKGARILDLRLSTHIVAVGGTREE
jgi:cell division protein FtsQ